MPVAADYQKTAAIMLMLLMMMLNVFLVRVETKQVAPAIATQVDRRQQRGQQQPFR